MKKVGYLFTLLLSIFCITNVYAEDFKLSNSYDGFVRIHKKDSINSSWDEDLKTKTSMTSDTNDLTFNLKVKILDDSNMEFIASIGDKEIEHTKGTYTFNDNTIEYTKTHYVENGEEHDCTNELITSETKNLCNLFTMKNEKVQLTVDKSKNEITYSGGAFSSLFNKVSLVEESKNNNWSTFANKMISKCEEEVGGLVQYNYEVSNDSVKVTAFYNGLQQLLTGVSYDNYSVEFSYDNGILTYKPKDNADISILIDNLIISKVIETTAETFNYDVQGLENYLNNTSNLSLEKDGVALIREIYSPNNGISTVSALDLESEESSEESYYYKQFQIDLDNGLKSYKPVLLSNDLEESETEETTSTPQAPVKETTVKNPKTGIYATIGIASIIVLITSAIGYIHLRKKSKFPQI